MDRDVFSFMLQSKKTSVLYLFWLVGIGQWYHHPDDVEVIEGSAGGEGAGQDGCLATSHLDAALGHGHIQRLYTHCTRMETSNQRLDIQAI